jgi:glycosyltransferase involved in cell wall biosynthesis
MRILCWGTYDTGKPRARLLLKGLRDNGVEVDERHANIWEGVADKSQLRGIGRKLGIALRWLGSYPRLAWQLARAPRPDVVLVGFPGVLDMLIAAPIARLRGIPVAWDMFMSLYDTVVEDRRLLRRGSLAARLLHAIERFALRRADFVFLDTEAHARRVETLFGFAPGSMGAVWVGAEANFFDVDAGTVATPSAPVGPPLRVLFYGQFIPLHGIETIIRAAHLTRSEAIEWHLIGKGQEAERIARLIDEQPLPRLRWDTWVDYDQLPGCIAAADICLGIFGTSEKAASVIPNKVFQIVATGRPVVTRDSPAIRELLEELPPCVYLVPPDDPAALVAALRDFTSHRQPACNCHSTLQSKVSAQAVGRQCTNLLAKRFGLRT